MSNNTNLSFLAILASVAFSFLNELFFALVVLVLVYWFLKDAEVTAKVLTPILIVLSVRLFQVIMNLVATSISELVAIFNKFNVIDVRIMQVVNLVINIWLVVFLVLFFVSLLQKKETPLYGKFSKLAANSAHNPKKENKQEESEDKEL